MGKGREGAERQRRAPRIASRGPFPSPLHETMRHCDMTFLGRHALRMRTHECRMQWSQLRPYPILATHAIAEKVVSLSQQAAPGRSSDQLPVIIRPCHAT